MGEGHGISVVEAALSGGCGTVVYLEVMVIISEAPGGFDYLWYVRRTRGDSPLCETDGPLRYI